MDRGHARAGRRARRGAREADREFSYWLVDAELDRVSRDDRAALINMARDPALARIILEETGRASWRLIWIGEMQPKRRGRPATGTDPMIGVRLPPEVTAAVDRAAADTGETRAGLIRRIVVEWLRERGVLAKEMGKAIGDTAR